MSEKKTKWIIALLLTIIVMIAGVAVYYANLPPSTPSPEKPPPKKLRIAAVFNGYVDWPGWCGLGFLALQYARDKYGAEITYVENVQFKDQERVLRALAEEGYDLIWGHSGAFDFTLPPVAEEYPNVKFLTTGGRLSMTYKPLPNVVSYDYTWRDAMFLAGALAAMMTRNGKVGFILGEPYPTCIDLMNAFFIGVNTTKPGIKTFKGITGSWIEVEPCKEHTISMVEQGVDVIGAWLDIGALGVGEAARERGIYVIFQDQDYYGMFSSTVAIGGTYFDFRPILDEVIQSILDGKFKGGVTHVLGIASYAPGKILDFKVNPELVPKDIREKIMELREKVIKAGGVDRLYPQYSWWGGPQELP